MYPRGELRGGELSHSGTLFPRGIRMNISMKSRRGRLAWELVLVAAISLLVMAWHGNAVFQVSDRASLKNQHFMSRCSGDAIAVHIERLAGDLARAAAAAGGSGENVRLRALLGQVIQQHPRLVRTAAAVRSDGTMLAGDLAEGWSSADVQKGMGRAPEGGGFVWEGPPASRPGSDTLLLIFTPAQSRSDGNALETGVAAAVETSELTRLAAAVSRLEAGQITLLLGPACRVLGAGGWEQEISRDRVGTLADIFPGDAQGGIRELLCSGIAPHRPVQATLVDGLVPALLGAVQVSAAGGEWVVISVLPQALARQWCRPLLLAGLGAILVMAFTAGLLVVRRPVYPEARARGPRDRRGGPNREESIRDVLAKDGLGNSREPVIRLRDLKIVGANVPALKALGLESEEAAGHREFLTFVAPEERERVERFLRGSSSGSAVPKTFQTRFVTTAGDRRTVEVHLAREEVSRESLLGVSWQDITANERAETLLRAVARSVPAAMTLLDPRGIVSWCNEAFSVLSGFRVEHFQGGTLMPLVVESDRRRAWSLMGRAARGRVSDGAIRVRLRSGSVDLFFVRTSPVFVSGALFGVLVLAQRFTGLGGAALSGDLGETMMNQEFLLNSLSHQLNNDLQSLFAVVEGLKGETAPDGKEAARLEVMLGQAAARARRLVLATRSGTGVLAPARLSRIVDRWAQEAQSHIPVQVRMLVKYGTTDDRVLADPSQLGLFLDMALETALAVLKGGGGVIDVSVDSLPQQPGLRLSVTDTGGVTDHGTMPGSGSSLMPARKTARAVAEMVARRHGGTAGSKERSGLGYRIWVDLPVWSGSGLPEIPLKAPRGTGAILVADDEETIRGALGDALRAEGRVVVEAANGAEAVEVVLAAPERFSLVVLDLVMPVMDGRAALRRLRELLPDMPILVCTGFDPAGDFELSTVDVLIKPFSVKDFLAKVAELVSSGEGGTTGPGDTMGS